MFHTLRGVSRERESPALRALRDLRGPNARIADLPYNRPIEAGDMKAIQKAGIESRKITALIKTYEEPSKIRGASREF